MSGLWLTQFYVRDVEWLSEKTFKTGDNNMNVLALIYRSPLSFGRIVGYHG